MGCFYDVISTCKYPAMEHCEVIILNNFIKLSASALQIPE